MGGIGIQSVSDLTHRREHMAALAGKKFKLFFLCENVWIFINNNSQ